MTNNKKHILVVEDDKVQSKSFESIISQIPYKYVSIDSGKEALKHLKNNNKDVGLVLLDLALMDIGGLEFLKEVKKFNNKVPIIILTANEEIGTAFKAGRLGADDYFIKWRSGDELKRLVRVIIETMEK